MRVALCREAFLAAKYGPHRVLNPLPRRIFRTRIRPAEHAASVAILVLLVLAGAWVLAQRDAYDPSERDISVEALRAGSVKQLPYHAPLERWREPGSAGAAAGLPDTGIFPSSILGDGWTLDGRVETYVPDTLYEKINGQAEQYLKFGFRELHYATLAREDVFVTIELYDQSRFDNALGVFASQRDPSRSVERRGGIHYYRTSAGAIGISNDLFFKIVASETSPAVTSKVDGLLDAIDAIEVPGESSARVFSLLTEKMGLPFERVAYEKQNALQLAFFERVWFGALDEEGLSRVFVHAGNDEDASASVFSKLVEEQSFEHSSVEQGDERALMQHEFLGTYFLVARRGPWIYGVDGVSDAATARDILARVEKELP